MKSRRQLFLLLLLVVLTSWAVSCQAQELEDEDKVEANEDQDLVQKNPDYVEPKKEFGDEDADDDTEDNEEEYDLEDEDYEEDTKSVLAHALGSKTGKSFRLALRFVSKHRVKITIALALYAFRKELGILALLLFATPKTIDPQTGKVLTWTVNIHPTSILKILLFLDLMRKLQSGDVSSRGGFAAQGSFLFKFLHPGNTAFVPPIEQHWTFERVNERYEKDDMAMQKAMTPGTAKVINKIDMRQSLKRMTGSDIHGEANASGQTQPRDSVIILDWTKLTNSIGQMSDLRDQVSFLLNEHRAQNNTHTPDAACNTTNVNATQPATEIVVLVESPGGAAADYGLAAQMILRLSHEPGMTVTVCVDKVAASGGYMIACCSSPGRLYAAPFAVLGSIGVIGSAINIHNVLEEWGVKPLVFRGGKDKAPVGLIGEVTKEGVAQVQSMVDATHVAFKRHVVAARPVLGDKIDEISTGNVWMGYEALNVGLIDRVITSDEYIGERLLEGARVLRLIKYQKPRFLFPSPHSLPNLSHTLDGIRSSLSSMMLDLAQPVSTHVSTKFDDRGLAAASSLLGISTSYSGAKK